MRRQGDQRHRRDPVTQGTSIATRTILLTILAAATTGCGGVPSSRQGLTVYAAASLSDVAAELESAWFATHPDVALTISTGSSAALRTQILQGAPADVFVSADVTNAQAVVDAGLADGQPATFAGNALTVIVPTDNPASILSPADLARDGVRVIAAGDEVPITRYAEQVVANLATLAGYPSDFAARYEANVASREDHVAAVVAKIALGEGDAAVVYATDAGSTENLASIPIPAEANVVADYAAVALATAGATEAREFVTWLTEPEAQAILDRHGFTAPR